MKKWVQFGTSDGLVSLVNPLELRVTSAAVVEDILNMDTLQEKLDILSYSGSELSSDAYHALNSLRDILGSAGSAIETILAFCAIGR